ncbi:multidrug MFS transporter [Thalassospira profundimaris]|uniref:Multidrug MFS transporter n=1 Tax=Thalassospira profundimaris TaxID=502049 RepID=A0A367XGY4_9PROT|nr:MFS transporter [Thalassospira profundimaris]RCK52390.1 multidrug MFS transporter [Thalassospira profundimaris]
MSKSPVIHEDGLPQPQRGLAFLTVSLAIMMAVLDGSIINVALPTIAHDQHVSAAHAIWVVTAYQLAVVIALLPLAALGEKIGFRKINLAGLVLFCGASILCAYSPTIEILTFARLVQGLGGAAMMSINGALVRHIMPVRLLGRGISMVAMVVAISAAAGPSIASAILAVSSWHWLFLINVPISILAFVMGYFTLPYNKLNGAKFDFGSAVLNALALGFLISALGSIGTSHNMALIIGQFIIALTAGIALVRRQLYRDMPLLPIDLLRSPVFTGSIIASICGFCAQFIAFVSLPFFFHDVIGYDAVKTGILMTPWPVATALTAPIAGRLADKYSAAPLTTIGMVIFATGLAATVWLPSEAGNYTIILALMLAGAGFALFQTPNNRIMLTSAPRERSGGASGLQSTARLLGQSSGAALAAILIAHSTEFSLALLMYSAAGFALISGCISAIRNRAWQVGIIS